MKDYFKKFLRFLSSIVSPDDESRYVIIACVAIVAAGVFFSLVIMGVTFFTEGIKNKDLCFSNSCFENLYSYYGVSFKIFILSLKASIGLFALGTFGIACKTYANNKNANAFSSHISYLSLFQHYVDFEISKRVGVSRESVDILHWYNVICPSSNVGDLKISRDYFCILKEVEGCIIKSNDEFEGPVKKHFDYHVHQRRIIEVLKKIGIELEPLPRTNFWAVETEVLSLIEVVNASFFKLEDFSKFTKRLYR